KTGLHHDQSRDCRPISFGHLHQARDDDGGGRREGRANGVSNRREILFLPAPEFHVRMILLANPFWQDRLQGKPQSSSREIVMSRANSRANRDSTFCEMSIFKILEKIA